MEIQNPSKAKTILRKKIELEESGSLDFKLYYKVYYKVFGHGT